MLHIENGPDEKLSSKSTRWSRSTVALVLIVVALCSATALLQATSSDQAVTSTNNSFVDRFNSLYEHLQGIKKVQEWNKLGSTEWSNETEQALRQLVDYIDDKVDPCDDFYAFACGNSLRGKEGEAADPMFELKNRVKEDLQIAFDEYHKNTGVRPRAVEEMYKFYDQCITAKPGDFNRELRASINKLGGIPVMLGDKWKEMEIGKTLDALLFWHHMPFFQFEYTTKPIQYIFIPQRFFSSQGSQNALRKTINEFAAAENIVLDETNWKEVEEMFSFIDKLSKIRMRGGESPNFNNSQLLEMIPQINFTHIIRWKFFSTENNVISSNTTIHFIAEHNALQSYFDAIRSTSNRVLTNYALISLYGLYAHHNIELKDCFATLNESHVLPLSYVYLKQFPTDQTIASRMSANILKAFRENLKNYDWLDDSTRKNALKKVDNMFLVIGQPAIEQDMQELYSMVPNTDGWGMFQSWMWMFVLSNEFYRFDSARKDLVRRAQYEVNAEYSGSENRFLVTRAIMNPHLYHGKFTALLNYARLGYVIGHEITHGFDHKGRYVDFEGKRSNWWSNATKAAFEEKMKCFAKLYESEFAAETFLREDGAYKLGENIADGGGFKQSYSAYKRYEAPRERLYQTGYGGYSGEQLFMIANAQTWCGVENLRKQIKDVHSLAKSRINFNLRNHNEFAEAFQCEIGTKMNPIRKDECHIW